jgi:hypothetical protein
VTELDARTLAVLLDGVEQQMATLESIVAEQDPATGGSSAVEGWFI